jgi:Lung seven transmembrane receptor
MVSLGWGVVRDDLGSAMKKIYVLGGLYVSVALVADVMTVVAYTEVQRLSQHEEDELFDIVAILNLVVTLIDAVFFFWIVDSLNATMEYLEAMKQTSKLLRYLRLRCIILFAVLFFVMYTVFGIVNNLDQGIVDQQEEWVLDASQELIYLFVLLGIAILWRPQENAREYAYVMELPSLGAATGDDDEGAGTLELSAVVPSAMDSDDDDEVVIDFAGGKSEGFQDEPH